MWRPSQPVTRYRIALALADADLQHAITDAIESHPALGVASPDEQSDLIIGDQETRTGPTPLLRADDHPLLEQADLELIVSAAHVMAAGYRLERAEPAASPHVALTPRERQVLTLIVDGAPNKMIARSLAISDRTAKFHVAAIFAKLHARNRAEAVAIAIREGLVVL